MMDDHVEFKDRCDEIESSLECISSELRQLPSNYKLIEQYTKIDQEVCEISEWCENNKIFLEKYNIEKKIIDEKLKNLENNTKFLNHETQNFKMSPKPSSKSHGGSYSQLSDN